MKRANTMSTLTVELIIKMKTKFTSSNAEKTNEKTNGFILPQMSNFHMERLLAATLVMPGKHAKSLSTSCVASPVCIPRPRSPGYQFLCSAALKSAADVWQSVTHTISSTKDAANWASGGGCQNLCKWKRQHSSRPCRKRGNEF